MRSVTVGGGGAVEKDVRAELGGGGVDECMESDGVAGDVPAGTVTEGVEVAAIGGVFAACTGGVCTGGVKAGAD